MEDVVYTLPERDKNDYLLDDEYRYDPVRLDFRYHHLPKADDSSGVVRFRSVTPKQQFVQHGDDPSDALRQVHETAMRHRQLAEDHIAAALWLSVCVPIVKAPKPRKQVSEILYVTVPLENERIQASDFDKARQVAGMHKGSFARDVSYANYAGMTGDGRYQHTFEVTYYWNEVSDGD